MKIYQAEQEAGLAEAIEEGCKISIASLQTPITQEVVERHLALNETRKKEDFDLYWFNAILVSTGWNGNDDVFDPAEVWAARHTPEHKPVNYQHDFADILGHTVANYAIDDDGELIADDIDVADLPSKFHLVTANALYGMWPGYEDKQERMDNLIAEISEGKWYVSMECFSRGFDYAMRNEDEFRVVARNEDTAFLTKYLRKFGGQGEYDGFQVGRVLRRFTFSGKGLVTKPANPESVILNTASLQNVDFFPPISQLKIKKTLSTQFKKPEKVYATMSNQNSNEDNMADNQELKDELKAVRAQLDEANEKLANANVDKVKADLEKAQKENDELQSGKDAIVAQLEESKQEAKRLEGELEGATARLADANKAKETVEAELAEVRAEQKRERRVASVTELLGYEAEAASEFVDETKDLSDDSFTKQVEVLKAQIDKLKAKEAELEKAGAAGTKASQPPKTTPAQSIPKSTNKPSPLEQAKANEEALDSVEDEGAPAYTGGELEDTLQQEIAAYIRGEED